jgi:hypothetical protein
MHVFDLLHFLRGPSLHIHWGALNPRVAHLRLTLRCVRHHTMATRCVSISLSRVRLREKGSFRTRAVRAYWGFHKHLTTPQCWPRLLVTTCSWHGLRVSAPCQHFFLVGWNKVSIALVRVYTNQTGECNLLVRRSIDFNSSTRFCCSTFAPYPVCLACCNRCTRLLFD